MLGGDDDVGNPQKELSKAEQLIVRQTNQIISLLECCISTNIRTRA